MPILPTATNDAAGWWAAALAMILAAGGLATLRRVRGTTLTAPVLWWITSALAIAAVEATLALRHIDAATLPASLWRYAAAVGTFCPLTAVLGAKRPQDRGWQWVVASLWLVLLVPVAQAVVAPGGTRLELFAAWRWLLLGFIAMGLLNYLPTRFALSALPVAAGQYLLLEGAAGNASGPFSKYGMLWGLGLLSAAWLSGEIAVFIRRPAIALSPQTRRWLAFRDGWGAFWAIRVLQRVNQTAELGGWPIRLQWRGLVSADADETASPQTLAPPIEAALNQSLDTMLRRFE
jgi:hypothetical protein